MLPSVAPAPPLSVARSTRKKSPKHALGRGWEHTRASSASASSPVRGCEAALEFHSCGVRQPPFQMKLKAMKLNQVLAYVPETTREGMRLTSTLGLPPQRNS